MRLSELIAEFADLDDQEKLEFLVEYSDELPSPSSGHEAGPLAENCRVRECQTPVYLWVDATASRVRLEADVPKQSPTVRGLMSVLVNGLSGASAAEIEAMPDDLVETMGLQKALGMQRQQGFRGVVSRIKAEVRRQTSADAPIST